MTGVQVFEGGGDPLPSLYAVRVFYDKKAAGCWFVEFKKGNTVGTEHVVYIGTTKDQSLATYMTKEAAKKVSARVRSLGEQAAVVPFKANQP
jgi:glycine cleavage system aminomethyltransferase T